MSRLYAIEVEPEVRSWLAGLSDRDFGRVDFMVGLLAGQAETAEVSRAQQAQKICEAEHGPAHTTFDRVVP